MQARPAPASTPSTGPAIRGESRVLLHGVPWDVYVQLGEDNPGVRLTYLAGELEVMSPSDHHELDKTMLARLLEAYADVRDLELNGFGNTTFRKRAKKRGLEPDECYVLRQLQADSPSRPDLAIEVVLTSWRLDKLEVYRGLGVPEVWVWRGERLEVHVLAGERYERRERSALLPELDLALLATFVRRRDQVRAVKEYRRAL